MAVWIKYRGIEHMAVWMIKYNGIENMAAWRI